MAAPTLQIDLEVRQFEVRKGAMDARASLVAGIAVPAVHARDLDNRGVRLGRVYYRVWTRAQKYCSATRRR